MAFAKLGLLCDFALNAGECPPTDMSGIYIHIPFCERKCFYCAFYSDVSKDWQRQETFSKALENELNRLPADFSPETLFIGGGTPTSLNSQALEKILLCLSRFSPTEFSCEVNPGTADASKLLLLLKSGVNRLSIGVQSFHDPSLETLGRIHTAKQAEETVRLARETGFKNINIDLMFGIPGQTIERVESDLEQALAFDPEHIAIYNLMYEEGTPMAGRTDRLDEALEREMYDRIRARLKGAGWAHYEISNFAKPGFECQHNRLYWNGGEYIGCGPAAHSHWKGIRWANAPNIEDYCANGPRHEFEERLDPEAKERETLVMGLRQVAGVEVSDSLLTTCGETFRTLEKAGLLIVDGQRVRLTEEALFVSDAVFSELVCGNSHYGKIDSPENSLPTSAMQTAPLTGTSCSNSTADQKNKLTSSQCPVMSKNRGKETSPLPMTRAEMAARGWDELDVLIITGDAYVDHPSFGAAIIGRVLEADGWRVGIIAQPDWTNPNSLTEMGRPRLFCGITAGNLDSMLAHYTAARRKRKEDAYTPGGVIGKRPNLASVVYTQLAKKAFPGVTTVMGGIEASLRRTAHYDYWQDKLRPSILQDSKADILVYGMGERAIREIARRIAEQKSPDGIPGTARLLGAKESSERNVSNGIRLPAFEECLADKKAVLELTRLTEREQNPFTGKPLVQFHAARALWIEPPAQPLTVAEMDRVYELPYTRLPHPSYTEPIPAFTMIKESVTVVRGCGGGCTFCGLGLHQGRFLTSRSEESVAREVKTMTSHPSFSGTITDLGGPTANLYGCVNGVCAACTSCRRASCLYPEICPNLELNEEAAIHLMKRVREMERVKHVFIQSGIRMDVALRNPNYIRELARHHVSGHLKVAPEHLHPDVLKKMRKPGPGIFCEFQEAFDQENRAAGKKQYLVPYFISNFPGSTEKEMKAVEQFVRKEGWKLQQTQDFIPLPMTPAASVYYTGLDYETGEPVPVIRGLAERRAQIKQLRPHHG